MKVICDYLIISILLATTALAQGPDTLWTRVYHLPGDQAGSDVCESKGGYVIAGSCMQDGASNYDINIFKINFEGNRLWNRIIGDRQSLYEVAYAICPTYDHGLMITGTVQLDEPYSFRAFLLKLDEHGDSLG
jgi:hypothetical protein